MIEHCAPMFGYLVIVGTAIAICAAVAITIANYERDKD